MGLYDRAFKALTEKNNGTSSGHIQVSAYLDAEQILEFYSLQRNGVIPLDISFSVYLDKALESYAKKLKGEI